MNPLERTVRTVRALPAPVRWLAIPLVLLAATALVVGSGSPPWRPPLTAPNPEGQAATYCQTLMKGLPETLVGNRRVAPDPSPYVALWASSPRTVLRCGVARPKSLAIEANRRKESPNVNNVQWYEEGDGHGGYRFTTTLRTLYVEVSAPAGSYRNYTDPLSEISTLVNSTIPDMFGNLNSTDDDAP
ncbi:DUF3515 domain-containing protein [Kitasatospora kifunensis]|uniref:DUF3515 domain-containing protein n=1 Tax=Kitasatospora kifunensis TaxID=58351 RepID=A0A7W7RBK3_KITKI|nr:DUF3515 domain-containing protein [Kitasatospora kifunensis]MBB4928835.1 hypothetical protein [Kitasatospora kifunensis]